MSRPTSLWKPYSAKTVEAYRCDFCGIPSRRHLLGWHYRYMDGPSQWTQRICPACAAPGLPGPTEQIHRSASAQ
jgi:hypothetical protein